MYNIDDLDKLYSKDSTSAANSIDRDFGLGEKLGAAPPTHANPLRGGQRQFDPTGYAEYMPNHSGVYEDRNLDILRGEEQPMSDKFGNALVQTVGKIGTQLADMAGGITSLATDWGDNRDYKNGFTEVADNANKWLDEAFPLYRSTQGTWGLTDASWWLQNASGLAASVTGFGIGGMGIAKTLGALGKTLGVGLKAEQALSFLTADPFMAKALAQAGERTLTAGTLAYAEGAMSGRNVYDQVYTAQLAQGKTDDEAKHIAAESAASAVQLNTMINTGMNMLGGMDMFFNHEKNAVFEVAKKNFGRLETESSKEWLSRLASETSNKYASELGTNISWRGAGKKALNSGREAVAEGLEELTNQFAERTGIEEGKKGKVHGFIDQLGQLSNYADRVLDQEGGLNFFMGAIAGPAQHALAASIPSRVQDGYKQNSAGELLDKNDNVVTDAGKAAPKYKWMSSIAKNRSMTDKLFTDVKGKVIEDATYLMNTEEAIKKAMAENRVLDAEELKDEYFQTFNRHSVHMGFEDHLKETYRRIASLDNTKTDTAELTAKIADAKAVVDDLTNKGEDASAALNTLSGLQAELAKTKGQTEAMKLGFTGSVDDHDYKKRAEEAIRDLDALKDIHTKVATKYGIDATNSSPEEAHIASTIFDRLAIHHLTKNRLNKLEEEFNKLNTNLLDDTTLETERTAAIRRESETTRKRDGLNNRAQVLKEQLATFQDFLNNPTTENLDKAVPLLQKLGKFTDGANVKEVLQTVHEKLGKLIENHNEQIADLDAQNLESPEFLAWVEKNPNKSYEDYIKYLNKEYEVSAEKAQYQAAIGELKDRLTMQAESLADLSKAKTVDKILKNTKNYFKTLEAKKEAENAEMMKHFEEFKKDQAAQEKAEKNNLIKLRGKYRAEMDSIQKTLPKLQAELQHLKDTLSAEQGAMSDSEAPTRVADLTEKIANISAEILSLTDRFKALQTLYNNSHPAAAAPVIPTPPPPPSTPTPPPPGTPPAAKAFDDMLRSLSREQRYAVLEELKKIKALTKEWSLNSLPDIPGSPAIMQLIKELLEEQKVVFKGAEVAAEIADEVTDTELPPEEIAPEAEIDLPIFGVVSNLEILDPNSSEIYTGESWNGIKQTSAENSTAAKSTEYRVVKKGDVFHKVSTEVLNPKVNIQVLLPTGLPPGTKLILSIDENYNGKVLDANFDPGSTMSAPKERESRFSDFVTPDGKILMAHETDQVKKLRRNRTAELNGTEIVKLKADIKTLKANAKKVATKTGKKKLASLEAKLVIETKKIKDKFEKLINIENLKTTELERLTENNFSNVPIKITTEDGEVVGYVHRNEWILQKADGTSNEFRNVVDSWMEGDTLITDNAQRTSDALLTIRRVLADQYNAGNKNGIRTSVTTKGTGRFVKLKNFEKASNHIKGTKFQLAHVQDANTLKGTNISNINIPGKGWQGWENRLIALLPMANGSHSPVPLVGEKLVSSADIASLDKENSETWTTIVRAVELHIAPVKDEVDAIKAATGFDVSTKDGFRNFMIQYYTYVTPTKNFLESTKLGNALDTLGTVAGKPTIKILERSALGERTTELEVEDGTLNEASKQALANLLSTRYKSPAYTKGSIKGLNHAAKFNFSIYTNGTWQHKEASNYNQYLLAHTKTNTTFAKASKGANHSVKYTDNAGRERTEYIYGVNPIVSFDESKVLTDNLKADMTMEDGHVSPTPKIDDAIVDGLDLDPFGEHFNPEILSSVGSNETPILTLQSLENLFTFTPLDERNDQTPQQMLNYYRKIGVTHLEEGFNPFKKCK